MVILEQIGDRQLLMIDRVELMYDRQRGLVVIILALPLHLLVRLGQQLHRFTPTMAALLAPGYLPLGGL
jgi:hypothetical protein